MRLLVCGSRTWTNRAAVNAKLNGYLEKADDLEDLEVVCGYDPAREYPPGPDRFAYEWAVENHVAHRVFPYHRHLGRAGGYTRNLEMADYLKHTMLEQVGCLAFWDGKSRGTKHMIDIARKAGIPVEVVLK